jgi:hypothetical protein
MKSTHNKGGKRPNAGRKPTGGIKRDQRFNFDTTSTTALWFRTLSSQKGGLGPALESLGPEGKEESSNNE